MKSKMSLHTRLLIKGIFHSLLQFICIFTFGWFNGKLFETAVIYTCFFIFRGMFDKQYHAPSIWLCTLYTIIVFYIISAIAPNKELSLLLIVLLTFVINVLSFVIREYLDLKAKFTTIKGVKIAKGMSKDVLLSVLKRVENITELETNILIAFYCERKSIQNIAFKYNYSYDRIWQIKSEALTKIKKAN